MALYLFLLIVILIVAYQLYFKQKLEQITDTKVPDLIDMDEVPSSKPKSKKIKIRIFDSQYTPASLQARPECLFLFGDNEDHVGNRGQAVVRNEPNAVGIVTKRRPYMNEDSFYDDDDYEANVMAIDQSFNELRKRINSSRVSTVYIPRAGLGTGLAQLPKRAPKTFVYILGLLYDLTEQYDPDQLSGVVGQWIQAQNDIVNTTRKKRISV